MQISFIELVIAGIALVLLGLQALLSVIMHDSYFTSYTASFYKAIASFIDRISHTSPAINTITLLFWAIIGLIVYSLFWMLLVMIIDIRGDIVISQYFVHSSSFYQSSFWLAAVSRIVLSVTFYAVTGAYFILLLRGIPSIYTALRLTFSSGIKQESGSITVTLLLLVAWLAGWHMLVVFRRLNVHAYKDI